jgi:small subunit ribosomal protein S16
MPARIRLQRHGKKGNAFFHIVIADGRAPRDGKFIENIGTYNPATNPATINLNAEKALTWLQNGAVPTDTCRAILSYKGIMYRNHLNKGIAKGALTEEQANAKFEKWVAEKETKIIGKVSSLDSTKKEAAKKRMAAETASKEAKAKAIAAKNTAAAEAPAVAEAEAPAAEPTAAEGEAQA